MTRLTTSLRISPAPFRSSSLSIPNSPFTPRTPLTPPPMPQRPSAQQNCEQRAMSKMNSLSPTSLSMERPPITPLAWMWTCHRCRRTYQLSATRRCLDDGHYFCAGMTIIHNWRSSSPSTRVKRHKPCGSEFDYQGWKTLGKWRRSLFKGESRIQSKQRGVHPETRGMRRSRGRAGSRSEKEVHERTGGRKTNVEPKKDCWNKCDYPSECRWGRRFGVHSPIVESSAQESQRPSDSPNEETEIPNDMPALYRCVEEPITPTLTLHDTTESSTDMDVNMDVEHDEARVDIWNALLASAERRRKERCASPLSTISEEAEEETHALFEFDAEAKRECGVERAINMEETIDPALLLLSSPLSSPIQPYAPMMPLSSAMGRSFSSLMREKTARRRRNAMCRVGGC
ncbi:hypothetical protein IQ07DRAFT_604465 [Pyrenochaeta sp. DS3sAY3a]|nr:hypothetical protein IQ07DRAFT_604465 [Pyrenochaeta sp. DS3sAY3a]